VRIEEPPRLVLGGVRKAEVLVLDEDAEIFGRGEVFAVAPGVETDLVLEDVLVAGGGDPEHAVADGDEAVNETPADGDVLGAEVGAGADEGDALAVEGALGGECVGRVVGG
jgi:hypothetical protein